MSSWKGRLARLGIALGVLLLAGATVQGVMTAFDRQRFARPGQMVDAGGHQLHMRCTGEGEPTVVLDAAALSTSAEWAWVQLEVARLTRVCSFDRSGLGYSESGDAPYDPTRVPDELHAALPHAGIRPPYLLAGHGLGAAFAEIYANRYGAELAGLVLIDPPSPRALAEPEAHATWVNTARRLAAMPWLARFGVLRLHNPLAALATGLPERQLGETRMFVVTPDHLARSAREIASLDRTFALLRQTQARDALRVHVIRATERDGQEPHEFALTSATGRAGVKGPRDVDHAIAGAADTTILSDRTYATEVARVVDAAVSAARSGRDAPK